MLRLTIRLGAPALALLFLVTFSSTGSAKAQKAGIVHIGIVKTVFRDVPPSWLNFVTQPLRTLMKRQTGLTAKVQLVENAEEMAALLKEDKIQLGVCHGIELGWARLANPKVEPLMIAVRKRLHLRACLVVRKDGGFKNCAELRGKDLVIPARSRLHCHLFLERRCPAPNSDPKTFFHSIKQRSSGESAIKKVLGRGAHAAIIDLSDLEAYKKKSPAKYESLHVLQQSEVFPAGLIVYHPGHLTESSLRAFQKGMRGATRSAEGRQLLQMSRIHAFKDIPDDYESVLEEALKAYPPTVKEEKVEEEKKVEKEEKPATKEAESEK